MELFSALATNMEEAGFDDVMTETFVEGVTQWILEGDPLDTTNMEGPIAVAVESQQAIGWGPLMRGFISQHWAIQNAKLQDYEIDVPQVRKMHRAILKTLLDFFLERWKCRNKALHGGTTEEQQQILRVKRNMAIDKIWDLRDKMLPRDQAILFCRTQQQTHEMTTSQQRNWIAFASVFVPKAITRKEAHSAGQTLITDFFQTRREAQDQAHQRQKEIARIWKAKQSISTEDQEVLYSSPKDDIMALNPEEQQLWIDFAAAFLPLAQARKDAKTGETGTFKESYLSTEEDEDDEENSETTTTEQHSNLEAPDDDNDLADLQQYKYGFSEDVETLYNG